MPDSDPTLQERARAAMAAQLTVDSAAEDLAAAGPVFPSLRVRVAPGLFGF